MFRRKLGKKGQAVAEYAILLALIVVVAYMAISAIGKGVYGKGSESMLGQDAGGE